MKINEELSDEKAAEISQQQTFEALKHLTTLDTGSILLLAGFIEKLFPNPQWKFLIYFTFVLLVLSMVSAVYSMFWLSVAPSESKPSKTDLKVFAVSSLTAFYAFIAGIVVFVVFVVKNV